MYNVQCWAKQIYIDLIKNDVPTRAVYFTNEFLIVIQIGFRSPFSQCVDYMRFNEKSFCFRWQETTKLMLFGNTKTSSLVILCDLRYLTGNISSVMTKHMGVQRKLHRFAYLIVQIILCFYSLVSHAILSLYFSSLSPAPEINTGNSTPAETTSEAY